MKKFIILSGILLFCHLSFAQTSIPGGNVYGTWTLSGSPYLIQGPIIVPNDSTLTIQPGVVVNFQGHYKFGILGRLLAIGTPTDSIVFTAANTTTGWWGFRLSSITSNNDSSKFSYCNIQWGNANGSGNDARGGAFFIGSSPKVIISHSRIENCSAPVPGYQGGGIYCENCSPIISNNFICNNNAANGGGIGLDLGGSPLISNNIIAYNSATANPSGGSGGGIYATNNSDPTVLNNLISNNSCVSSGGGIYCNFSYPMVSGNIIVNNTVFNATGNNEGGGGVYLGHNYSQTLFNNTIANNSVSGSNANGGGIFCYWNSNPVLKNNILYKDSAALTGNEVFIWDQQSQPNFYYCDVKGGTTAFGLNGNFYTGTYSNNLNANPLFVAPSGGSGNGFDGLNANWQLQNNSSCVDAGDPIYNSYPATDLAGNTRVTVCRIDIGAYENQYRQPLSFTFSSIAPTCYGSSDGSITINTSGGLAPYTYSWYNGQTTATATGLADGTYSVLITETAGCTLLATAYVTQPANITANITTSNSSCTSICNGGANALISGGTSPYNYSWNSGCTSTMCSNLCQGNYTLFVTDANGCIGNFTTTVNSDPSMTASFVNTDVTCNGGSNGASVVQITNGTAPYLYSWSTGATIDSIGGLTSGPYSIVITDSNGCSISAGTSVNQPSVLSVNTNVIANAGCGDSTGNGSVSVSGGTSPYTYSWTNGSTNQTISNISAGTYSVFVTDNNGCTSSGSLVISNSVPPPTPSICMVTVDSLSQHNIIIWDKTSYTNIDSFIVYREITTNNYQRIGAVPYDSLSLFIDTVAALYFPNTGNPNAGTYRYKLQVRDTCGNYSQLSPYHNTIFIVNTSGNFSWAQLYSIENSSNPVNNYVLMRDDFSNGNWQPVNSVAGTQQNVSDPNYNSWVATASWRVQTMWNISCTPILRQINNASSIYSTSKSNKTSNVTSVNDISLNDEIYVSPNPSNDIVFIKNPVAVSEISIWDIVGNEVFKTNNFNGSIDLSGFNSGTYILKINTKRGLFSKRIVKI